MVVPRHLVDDSGDLALSVEVPPPLDIGSQLRLELEGLRRVPGLLAAAVTRRDGLAIQHTFRSAREAAALCAMAAAMVGAARSAGAELEQGEFDHGMVRFGDGILFVKDAGPEAILACLFRPDANLGLALLKIARVSEEIEEILENL